MIAAHAGSSCTQEHERAAPRCETLQTRYQRGYLRTKISEHGEMRAEHKITELMRLDHEVCNLFDKMLEPQGCKGEGR